jgi:hypothetical protein
MRSIAGFWVVAAMSAAAPFSGAVSLDYDTPSAEVANAARLSADLPAPLESVPNLFAGDSTAAGQLSMFRDFKAAESFRAAWTGRFAAFLREPAESDRAARPESARLAATRDRFGYAARWTDEDVRTDSVAKPDDPMTRPAGLIDYLGWATQAARPDDERWRWHYLDYPSRSVALDIESSNIGLFDAQSTNAMDRALAADSGSESVNPIADPARALVFAAPAPVRSANRFFKPAGIALGGLAALGALILWRRNRHPPQYY